MKKMHFFSLPETGAFVLLLLLLASGLLLALTNPNLRPALVPLSPDQAVTAPTATLQPSPTSLPTSTPLPPWTESAPALSAEAIAPLLEDLAQKNMQYWMRPGWVYSQTSDKGQPGMIQMYSNETWTRYSVDSGSCPEMLAMVKEKPDSPTVLQMQVALANGSYGDLLTLRTGESQVGKTNQGCPPQAETTLAGILARRITRQPTLLSKGSANENLASIRAWYAPLDGKTVLVVWATFDTPAGMTPKTVESYWFDLSSGLPVQQGMRMEREDGGLTGETLMATQYAFLPALPSADASRVSAALAELQALAASPVILPTATPLPDNAVAELSKMAFTQDAPLTDGQEILDAMAALRQAQLNFLSKPGWYRYGLREPVEGEISNRYNLLHVLDDGQCELLTYYFQIPEERVAATEIRLADGAYGLTDIRKTTIEDGIASGSPCSPLLLDSLTLLNNEMDYFGEFVAGKVNGTYKAWVETINGRRVFVLFYDIHYLAPKPNILDPDTHAFEVEDRAQEWKYFDLENGANLGNYYQITLENGKVFGQTLAPSAAPDYELKYMLTPPDNLLQAFNKAVEELHGLLEKKQ